MDEARRRTLHGRRRGKKLRAGQQSLLDTLLPRLALVVPAEPAKIDLAQAFGGTLPPEGVWLEVGFGAGEHLVWQAEQHPGVGLIGCEPYMNGVAKCLAHIERAGVTNIRLFTDDARFVMARAAAAFAVARLRAVSRSLAEDPPSQAALRAARDPRRAGGSDDSRGGTASRHRRSELFALDGRAGLHPSGLRLAGRGPVRLARAAGGLAGDAIREKNAGGQADLFAAPPSSCKCLK